MPKINQPIVGDSFHDVITNKWYQQFVTQKFMDDMDDTKNNNHCFDRKNIIFQILEAANFMEISPLIDLICLWCTFQISGKSTEEVCHRHIVSVVIFLLSHEHISLLNFLFYTIECMIRWWLWLFTRCVVTVDILYLLHIHKQIRLFLNLPKMTPEEEAQARAEHPWIFESITPS